MMTAVAGREKRGMHDTSDGMVQSVPKFRFMWGYREWKAATKGGIGKYTKFRTTSLEEIRRTPSTLNKAVLEMRAAPIRSGSCCF